MGDFIENPYLTYQEAILNGDNPQNVKDWYQTVGGVSGEIREEEIREERKRLKVIPSPIVMGFLPTNGTPGFTLEELDESGETVRDPRIVEMDLDEKGEITSIRTRDDLYVMFYAKLKEVGIDPHLRPAIQTGEGPISTGENIG